MVLAYDPFSVEAMTDPHPLYRALRDSAPVYRLEAYDAWALSRFDDVWEVLEDRDRFSIAEGPIFHRDRLLVHNDGPPVARAGRPVGSFSVMDPPEHTRLRQAMHRSFTPRAAAARAAEIAQAADDQLDTLAGKAGFDIVADYAGPVSVLSTLRFLGLPVEDADRIRRLVNESTRREPGQPGTSPSGAKAAAALHAHIVDEVGRNPSELVAALAALPVPGGEPLSEAEIATQITTLLVGGVETLPKIIAGGLARLAREPEQLAALRADADLVPGAFDEIVRLEGVLQFIGRTLLTEARIGGQAMRAGQRVLLLLQSANRDEREFPDPERFDITRSMPRHVGFGHGTHFCIGVHAARTTGMALLDRFLRRYRSFEVDLAGAERPASEFQIGWTRMPVLVDGTQARSVP